MRIISFVTQKGGSGKSTLASSLAVAAKEAGERVFVVDLDPQNSLVSWAKTRGADDVPVSAVTAGRLPATLAALEKNGFTLAIIDTAGAESAAAISAMKAADLNIIPSRPNIFDLWASELTRATLRQMRADYVFVLNQCPPAQQTARVEEGAAALEAMGGLLTPLILSRVDFQEAARHGRGVTEVNPGGAAASEIKALWNSIKRRMARGKPVRKAA
ncbi:MAG TPA: ParA family protein [Roseiarcus sp.]|nr:ParA family protein [Roseiarcus sp.]